MRDSPLHGVGEPSADCVPVAVQGSDTVPHDPVSHGAPADDIRTSQQRDDLVDLDVSGTRMTVLRSTLCAGPPTSILRRMFDTDDVDTTSLWRPPVRDGAFYLNYDPRHFAAIINALRYGADVARFGDVADVACVRGLAAYLGLYDIEAECAYAVGRIDDTFDPDAHATISFIFEDSLGDGDHRLGVGCLPATVRVPRRWRASRALDAIADALDMRRTHLRFYTAYTNTTVLHGVYGPWSRDRLSIGAPIDPAPTSTVHQFPWARHAECIVFVARAPVAPRVALCKIYDAASPPTEGESNIGCDLLLRPGVRPLVFCLPPAGAAACDVVKAACVRAGVDVTEVVAAYIEHQGGGVDFTRLAFPAAPLNADDDDDDDDDDEVIANHMPHGEALMLFVGSSPLPNASSLSNLLETLSDVWMGAGPVGGDVDSA
ncbi:Btb/poz domain-containing protein [Pandoravirus kuranda]|uniref:Btb/poz domain-containing protein n=1 Tax=Pandoravirus kuranda TaxID=3019033 RepID=A0AA95J4Q9_9VIRU|nr:Btb/poz domain-containing protein [Pandoravirus kuranda]